MSKEIYRFGRNGYVRSDEVGVTMGKCKHNKAMRKAIVDKKPIGEYKVWCGQQCKKMVTIKITQKDIDEVFFKKGD